MTLTDIFTPTRVSENEFVVQIPESWRQGRGTFGGLVIGAMVRCVELYEPDAERTVRSLTAEIPAPVPSGPARIVLQTLRRGSALSTIRASIIGEGGVLADLVAVVAKARPGTPTWQEMPVPEMKPWREIQPAPVGPPIAPEFIENMELRVLSEFPFMGGTTATASGWVRAKEPGEYRGAAYLAALVDTWWPAGAARFDGVRPLATVTFTMEIVGSMKGLDPDAPAFYLARCPISDDGYMVEFRELWGADGRLLALNQQTMAIIK